MQQNMKKTFDKTSHCLILGQTGAGKTVSVMQPLLYNTLLQAGPVFVIDAKNEYESILVEALRNDQERMLVLNGQQERVNPFYFDQDRSLREKVLEVYQSVETTRAQDNGSNGSFAAKANAVLASFMDLFEAYEETTHRNLFEDACVLFDNLDHEWEETPAWRRRSDNEEDTIDESTLTLKCLQDAKKVERFLPETPTQDDFFQTFKNFIECSQEAMEVHLLKVTLELVKSTGIPTSVYGFLRQWIPRSKSDRATSEQWFYNTTYYSIFFRFVEWWSVNIFSYLDSLLLLQRVRGVISRI